MLVVLGPFTIISRGLVLRKMFWYFNLARYKHLLEGIPSCVRTQQSSRLHSSTVHIRNGEVQGSVQRQQLRKHNGHIKALYSVK